MNLLTLTGPSGSGKTTLLNKLVAEHGFEGVVSHTTRNPRPGEVNGKDYYFISDEDFENIKSSNGFIESVEFIDKKYGVSLNELRRITSLNKKPVLIVEPHGKEQIRKYFADNQIGEVFSAFLSASPEILISRYLSRLSTGDIIKPEWRMNHAKRILSINEEWRNWFIDGTYDILYAMIDQEDLEKNIISIIEKTQYLWQ